MFAKPRAGATYMAASFVSRRANIAASQGRCLVPWILAWRITASAPVVADARNYGAQIVTRRTQSRSKELATPVATRKA